jgi:hypothetical protein
LYFVIAKINRFAEGCTKIMMICRALRIKMTLWGFLFSSDPTHINHNK